MNQIPHCNWLPEGARQSYFARSGFLAWFRRAKIIPSYNKSFIYETCSVKMAGYLPRSFFACLWTETKTGEFETIDTFFCYKHLFFWKKILGRLIANIIIL